MGKNYGLWNLIWVVDLWMGVHWAYWAVGEPEYECLCILVL